MLTFGFVKYLVVLSLFLIISLPPQQKPCGTP